MFIRGCDIKHGGIARPCYKSMEVLDLPSFLCSNILGFRIAASDVAQLHYDQRSFTAHRTALTVYAPSRGRDLDGSSPISRWLYKPFDAFLLSFKGPTICRSHASAQSPDFYWVRYAQMYSRRTHKHTIEYVFANCLDLPSCCMIFRLWVWLSIQKPLHITLPKLKFCSPLEIRRFRNRLDLSTLNQRIQRFSTNF